MKYTIWPMLGLLACGGSAPGTPPRTVPAHRTAEPPIDLAIRVIRWSCTITDPAGVDLDLDELRLPAGRSIRAHLRNADRAADLDIEAPNATVHIPRRGTAELAFTFDTPGTYSWKCPVQEPEHSPIPNPTTHPLVVLDPAAWATYIAEFDAAHDLSRIENLVTLGQLMYKRKGCSSCHTVDGAPRVGPSWAGIWGRPAQLSDGSTKLVDADYVRESVLHPSAFARPGYPPVMPSFEGQLGDRELAGITAYIESLAGTTP